jgi:hypothetical protein
MKQLKRIVLLCLALLMPLPLLAQSISSKTYYDSLGVVTGISRNYGSGTTYYDGMGAPVGRSANYSDAPMVSLLPYTPQPVQSDVEGAVARAYRTAYGDSSTSSYQPLFIFPHVPY